jgi:hypothetical protein
MTIQQAGNLVEGGGALRALHVKRDARRIEERSDAARHAKKEYPEREASGELARVEFNGIGSSTG